MLREFKIFDHVIKVKDSTCSRDGKKPQKLKPYVNLYVKLGNACQAECKFCEYHGKDTLKFDEYKLYYAITRIQKAGLRIAKINFTGGEPSIYASKLIETVQKIREIQRDIFVTVNTNGYKIEKIQNNYADGYFDCISISRHHHDDSKNHEIFGVSNVAGRADIKSIDNKRNIHLRCNLIKGYIDSAESIKKYLDVMSSDGVYDFGFVSLMQINDFCKENFVDYSKIDIESIPNVRLATSNRLEDFCSCKNYLYYNKHGIVSFYARFNGDSSRCESTLVYDIDKLTDGFGGKVII